MTLRYLAYGSIMGCSSSLNNLFVTFYLDLFLDLPAHVFLSGQFVYMVWNSVNDPVCGWISDRLGQASRNPRQTRLGAIKYGGLLWAVAFFAVWLAPPTSASDLVRFTHFCLATCAYDTMLTLVEVNHSALLAELTSADAERAAFNGYSAVFAGLGSLTSFAGHFFWDRGHMRAFQACCLLIACVCGAVFYWSAEALRLPAQTAVAASAPASTPLKKSQSLGGVVRFVKELTMQRNFWVFAAVSTVQSFDCAFEKTSFAVVLDQLASGSLSKPARSAMVSSSFLLPWAGTLLVTPLIQARGVYSVFGGVLLARMGLCVLFVLLGARADPQTAALFLLANRVASETVCRISPLVLSDLVDEDRFIHKRDEDTTRSGSVVGGAHFLSKFGASAGPVLGYVLFSAHQELVARFLVGVPLLCVALQLVVWLRFFSLHGAHLRRVKEFVEGAGAKA